MRFIFTLLFFCIGVKAEDWQLPPRFAEMGVHAACAANMPGAVVACPDEEVDGRKCNFDILKEMYQAHPYQHCMEKICGKDGEGRNFRKYDFNKNYEEIKNKISGTFGKYAKEYGEAVLASAKKGIELQKTNKRFRDQLVFDKTINFESERFRNSLAGVITKFPISAEEKRVLRERVHPEMDEELFNWKIQYENEYFRVKKRMHAVDAEAMIQVNKTKAGQLKYVDSLISRSSKLPDHVSKKEPILQNLNKIKAYLLSREEGGFDSHGSDILTSMHLRIAMEEERSGRRSLKRLEKKIFDHKDTEKRGYDYYEKEINGKHFRNYADSLSKKCVKRISLSAASLATEEDMIKLKANISHTRNKILKKMNKYYSRETSAGLKEHLLNVPINIPPSREKFLSEMEKVIKEKTERFKGYNEKKRAMVSLHLMSEDTSMIAFNQDCFSEMMPNKSAHVVTGHHYLNLRGKVRKEGEKNLIKDIHVLSLSTKECHDYHVEGEGTIAHELGHLVGLYIGDVGSSESKRAHYENIMCIRKNKFKDDNDFEKAFSENNSAALGWYQEEDYADAFGATFAPSEENQWCSKFYREEHVRRYDWMITDELTSHSTAAFRVLNVEVHKGNSIPQICLDEMKGRGQEKQLKNCFIPKN